MSSEQNVTGASVASCGANVVGAIVGGANVTGAIVASGGAIVGGSNCRVLRSN